MTNMTPTQQDYKAALADFDAWMNGDLYTYEIEGSTMRAIRAALTHCASTPQVTDEMVERAAIAMLFGHIPGKETDWEDMHDTAKVYWREQAKLALSAAWGIR